MYQGKHQNRSAKRSKKPVVLLVSLLLAVVVTLGGTLAYLTTKSPEVENNFTPSQVTTKVNETFSGGTKTNVSIENTGDTEAYIRAAVVITWQDADGNVYGQAPVKGTDYTNWEIGENWLSGNDGFYYYTKPVAPNTSTADALIASISPISNSPAEDYYLTVEIIGSGIQSVPAAAFNAWAPYSGITWAEDGLSKQGG